MPTASGFADKKRSALYAGPEKTEKGFDPAAFQAAAKAGQQQAYLQQNLDPDTKAKLEAVLNDKERLQQMLNSPQAKALMEKLGRQR